MENNYEYIIKPGGLVRRETTEQPIDINASIIEQLASNVSRKATKVFPMKLIDPENEGIAGVTIMSGGVTCWSLPLQKIQIKTFYQTKDGVVFPVFDDTTSPELDLEWVVPQGLYLTLAVMLEGNMHATSQYLVAWDSSQRIYRLPISNLYADCKLCWGKYKSTATCHVEALAEAVANFYKSPWQKDLYDADAEKRKKTRSLFRFKVEEKGFSQLPRDGEWTSLCEKIGNDFITENIFHPIFY